MRSWDLGEILPNLTALSLRLKLNAVRFLIKNSKSTSNRCHGLGYIIHLFQTSGLFIHVPHIKCFWLLYRLICGDIFRWLKLRIAPNNWRPGIFPLHQRKLHHGEYLVQYAYLLRQYCNFLKHSSRMKLSKILCFYIVFILNMWQYDMISLISNYVWFQNYNSKFKDVIAAQGLSYIIMLINYYKYPGSAWIEFTQCSKQPYTLFHMLIICLRVKHSCCRHTVLCFDNHIHSLCKFKSKCLYIVGMRLQVEELQIFVAYAV